MMKFLLPTIGVAILAGAIFFAKAGNPADSLKCPSAYPTAEEATASFQTFSNNYYTSHPGASVSDLLKARYDFYVSHNCTQELDAYKQAQDGTADPGTMGRIDEAIRQ